MSGCGSIWKPLVIKLMLNGGYVSHRCFSCAALVRRHAVQSNTDAHETNRFYWLALIEIRGRSHWLVAPVIFPTHGTLDKVERQRTGVLSLAVLVVIINREIVAPEEVLSGGCRAVFWAPTLVRTKCLSFGRSSHWTKGLSFGHSSHRTTAER